MQLNSMLSSMKMNKNKMSSKKKKKEILLRILKPLW